MTKINVLKRLERASRDNQQQQNTLRAECHAMVNQLRYVLPTCIELPPGKSGQRYQSMVNTGLVVCCDDSESGAFWADFNGWSVQCMQSFAEDVANGWLVTLAEWLEGETTATKIAHQSLQRGEPVKGVRLFVYIGKHVETVTSMVLTDNVSSPDAKQWVFRGYFDSLADAETEVVRITKQLVEDAQEAAK